MCIIHFDTKFFVENRQLYVLSKLYTVTVENLGGNLILLIKLT